MTFDDWISDVKFALDLTRALVSVLARDEGLHRRVNDVLSVESQARLAKRVADEKALQKFGPGT